MIYFVPDSPCPEKKPIETSYSDVHDDSSMIGVEASMDCNGAAMYSVVVNSSL
jgi:hypothetical protein